MRQGFLSRAGRCWRLSILAAVLVAATTLAACGSSDSDKSSSAPAATGTQHGASSAPTELTKMKVAYLPSVQFAPLFLAKKLGYYEDAGLDVELVKFLQGSTLVPALLKGQIDGTITSWAAVAIATSAGLPIQAITTFDIGATDPKKDTIQLLVGKDSGITDLKQLEGKTIAVNATQNLSEIQTAAVLKKAGVTAKYVAIPYPNQGAALRAGTVDAVSLTEPFITQLNETYPLRSLAGMNSEYISELPVTSFIMTKEYLAKNADTAKAFMEATDKATEYAATHPDETREMFPQSGGVTPEVAAKVIYPNYSPKIDLAKLNELAKSLSDNDLTESLVDMSTAIAPIAEPKVVNK